MHVSVFKPNRQKNYVCQWLDPVTGRKVRKSTGTAIKRDAERFAGKLEEDLNNGTYHRDVRITWEAFRDRFESEYLPRWSKGSQNRYSVVLNRFEEIIDPKLLVSVDEATISRFEAQCRKDENAEATIMANLTHLKAALNWAKKQKLIPVVPHIETTAAVSTKSKGRPITTEEFERMIEQIPVLESKTPEEWEFLLWGLWWSGLRLGEALNLHWTDERNLCVDLENEVIVIQAHAQKKRQYTETPMAPQFADMLRKVPEEKREGFVFNPIGNRDRRQRIRVDTASRLISQLGEKAGVKVSQTASGKPKYASAHDLRRAFGKRWSRLVMPTQLKELMRHADIKTTMEFYVGQDARDTSRHLRSVLGDILGDTTKKSDMPEEVLDVNPCD